MVNLDKIKEEFQAALNILTKEAEVLNLKSEYVGKNGVVSEILKSLKSMNADERKSFGPKANDLKDFIQDQSTAHLAKIEAEEINNKLKLERVDITLTDLIQVKTIKHGGYHPRTIVQQEIEDIFLSMGFDILDGPHIEDEFHNFNSNN